MWGFHSSISAISTYRSVFDHSRSRGGSVWEHNGLITLALLLCSAPSLLPHFVLSVFAHTLVPSPAGVLSRWSAGPTSQSPAENLYTLLSEWRFTEWTPPEKAPMLSETTVSGDRKTCQKKCCCFVLNYARVSGNYLFVEIKYSSDSLLCMLVCDWKCDVCMYKNMGNGQSCSSEPSLGHSHELQNQHAGALSDPLLCTRLQESPEQRVCGPVHPALHQPTERWATLIQRSGGGGGVWGGVDGMSHRVINDIRGHCVTVFGIPTLSALLKVVSAPLHLYSATALSSHIYSFFFCLPTGYRWVPLWSRDGCSLDPASLFVFVWYS